MEPLQNREFSDVNVRVVEPNLSREESTEQRIFGANRNNVDTITSEPNPPETRRRPANPNTENSEAESPTPRRRPVNIDTSNTSELQPAIPVPDFISERNFQPRFPQNVGVPNTVSNPSSSIADGMNAPEYYFPNYIPNRDQTMYLPTRRNYIQPNLPSQNTTTSGSFNSMMDQSANERDMEYLQQLYPMLCRKVHGQIEEECDRLEYDGSYIFDEYPDRVRVQNTIDRLYDQIKAQEDLRPYLPEESPAASAPLTASTFTNEFYYQPNWLREMIGVMFLNEMYQRRCRYRCNRRRWYY